MKYKPLPFWSWNAELDENKLVEQIDWMYKSGIGGFFMHARGGLTTKYLGKKWFSCVDACLKRGKELGMHVYAYDENGWPSGFAGGKLLKQERDRDCYLTYSIGEYDPNSYASYDISNEKIIRTNKGSNVLNIYCHSSTSTADILNKNVVKKFINITHEKYKKADKYGNLKGFFTDEPQYQRWAHPYTHCLETYFKKVYKIDIKDCLGLLFVEKQGYRSFRYKYWKSMQELMLSSYSEQIYNWCEKNGYIATGHYIEESSLYMQMENCAGIMPNYEYEHIPGMDWLGRNIGNDFAPKQLGSVASQLGKKQVLTESFALVGWDATPEELKHIFEWQAVCGISLLCHHLLPYSEKGQRKRDYPEHYSNINPWASEDFSIFNNEITNIGKRISLSDEIVNVGVFHPIRSCYFNYKREDPVNNIKELDDSVKSVTDMLGGYHIPYHFIDETLLKKYGSCEKNKIKLGLCCYDVIIFPLIYTMDRTSEAIISQYVKNGGKVLLLGEKPTFLEGEEYNYSYLKSNISIEDIIKRNKFSSSENPNIRISYRKDIKTKKKFFYIVNLGDETSFTLNGYNLHFKKWESRFINEQDLCDDSITINNIITLGNTFKVSKECLNYLTLDLLRYSKDGKKYSDLLHHMGIFDILLHEKYKGNLYLKYEFDIKEIPTVCSCLIENQNVISFTINGVKVKKKNFVLEKDFWEYDIAKYLRISKNDIVVEINYFQNESVYYALFGENVTESLINCLTYPTSIEPIYLKGNFGVFGDFTKGREENVYIANKFYIGKENKEISSLILDGFPFFRGKIELQQEINIDKLPVTLSIPGRFSLLEININGVDVAKMMFGHEIDISKFVKIGKNTFKITLTVSNRNLLGPFHTSHKEEPIYVGPDTFERKKTWKKGRSNTYRDSYAFVKTII